MSSFKALTNEETGDFEVLSFTQNPVPGYVIGCADDVGNFEWVDPGTFGVTSIQGTNNQVFANGTYGTEEVGDIVLTLPQSIATNSDVKFNSIVLDGLTASQYLKSAGDKKITSVATIPITDITGITANNPLTYSVGTFGLSYTDNLQITGSSLNTIQDIKTTSPVQFGGMLIYGGAGNTFLQLYNVGNTISNLFDYIHNKSGGLSALQLVGQETKYMANSVDALVKAYTSYTTCVTSTSGSEKAFTLYESLEGGVTADVFGFIGHSCYLPRLTASTYLYIDSNKYIVNRSASDFKADVLALLSASAPLSISSGNLTIAYTGNLQLTGSSLDTIQDIKTSSSPQFATLYIDGGSSTSYMQLYNDSASVSNLVSYIQDKVGGVSALQLIGQEAKYMANSVNTLVKAYTSYTTCVTSTSGSEKAFTLYESLEGGVTADVFGFIGHSCYLPRLTASTYLYIDSNKYIVNRSASDFKADVLALLSASAPLSISSGNLTIAYTGNLQLTGSSLDTIQDIKTSSSPQFLSTTLKNNGTSNNTLFLMESNTASYNNLIYQIKYRTGGLNSFENINQWVSYGENTSGAVYPAFTFYTYNNSSTAGATVASTIFESAAGDGKTTPLFGFVGGQVYFPTQTVDCLLYSDVNKFLQSVSLGTSLSFSGGSLNTIQDIRTSASPTFTGLTLSGLTASQYVKTNGSKLLVSSSSIPASDITGISGVSPITYASGAIGFDYKMSSDLQMQNNILYLRTGDTSHLVKYSSTGQDGAFIQGWNTISFNTLETKLKEVARFNTVSLNLPLQTASTYAYIDSSKDLVTRSTANFTSDVRGCISAGNSITITSGAIDTIQDIRTSASPTFTGMNLSGSTGNTYTIFDSSKNLVSRSTVGFQTDVRSCISAGSGISISSGSISTTLTQTAGDWSGSVFSLSNLSAASWTFGFYTRLGNYVNYSGGFTVSINTGSLTTFGCHIDVPVNSAWSAQSFACNGSCICEYQSSGNNKSIAAYISNATDSDIRFTWYPVSAPDSPQTMNVQFNLMYKVI